jgi:hypothetical protein
MAEKLMKYYQYIAEEKGMVGRLKLAQMTKIPSTRASLEEDSLENINIFKNAIQKLTKKPAPKL